MMWTYWTIIFAVFTVDAGLLDLSNEEYHNYTVMTTFLQDFSNTYKNLTTLYKIGKSVEGRDLLVVNITGGKYVPLRPNVKLVANVHGNEAVGRELLLHFAKHLVKKYNEGDKRVKRLLDNTHIHILPSLNPDGYEKLLRESNPGVQASKLTGHGSPNAKGVDINTDFDSDSPQEETMAMKSWMEKTPFVLSASLGGGSVVVYYPYAGEHSGEFETQDSDVFVHLASHYAHKISTKDERMSCSNKKFPKGISNGSFSSLQGSMMDYNYDTHGCMEITVQLSCHKFPWEEDLSLVFNQHTEPLMGYLEEVRRGLRGIVLDVNGHPVPNATLKIKGRDSSLFHTSSKGEFWRVLLKNIYGLQVEAEGFETKTERIRVDDPEPEDWELPKITYITLDRIGSKTTKKVPPQPKTTMKIPVKTTTATNNVTNKQYQTERGTLAATSDGITIKRNYRYWPLFCVITVVAWI